MGGGAKTPAPSAEERALQKNQAELLAFQTQILKQQQAQQAVLLPFLAEQEGFDVELDEAGNIKSISKTPSEVDDLRKELELGLTKRSLDALAGNLPVDPGLERDLGRQEETLRERLSRQLGPGYETSSAGIEALQAQSEGADVLRAGARTGQLTLAEQLGITRQQQNEASQAGSLSALSQGAVGNPLALAGAFSGAAAGYGQAQQPFIQQRQLQTQASIANSQRGNPWASIAGTAFGAFFSDKRMKTDIKPTRDSVAGVPIKEYRYKTDARGTRRRGPMAQDVEREYPDAVGIDAKGRKYIDRAALARHAANHAAAKVRTLGEVLGHK